jgi:hypothetical protein
MSLVCFSEISFSLHDDCRISLNGESTLRQFLALRCAGSGGVLFESLNEGGYCFLNCVPRDQEEMLVSLDFIANTKLRAVLLS